MAKKLLIIFIIASAFLITACRRTPEQRAERAMEELIDVLDLKEDQVAHLEKIKDDFMAKRMETAKARGELLDDAIDLMQSRQIEKDRLDSMVLKSRNLADGMISFFFLKYAELHDMLTPEQREKLASEMKRLKQKKGAI